AALARRTPDHALPRRAAEHDALVRHGAGGAGLRLRACGVDRGRVAATRRSQHALTMSPGADRLESRPMTATDRSPLNWRRHAGRALEMALDRALALDPDTRASLRALDGRRVALAIE